MRKGKETCVTIEIARWCFAVAFGSVTSAIMASGAYADELTALKAQLDGLGAQVSRIEAPPATALPQSFGSLSIRDGQGNFSTAPERMSDRINPDSGATISVFPTAEPAPSAEI